MNSQHTSLGNCALSTLVSLVVSVFTVTGQAKAQCQYEVTILQYPLNCGIGTVITAGLSLNENGAVVGYYSCPLWVFFRPFLWTAEEGFTDLGLPPGVMGATAADINEEGIICGTMYVTGVGYRGFVYEDGEWTELPPVVDVTGAWSSAAAINNDGIVVGQRSITENLTPHNAYIWTATEGFTDLGIMNGPYSSATDISQGGAVTGWTGLLAAPGDEAFIWEAGERTLLGPIPGGLWSDGNAVADERLVAGSGRIPIEGDPATVSRAFIWQAGEFTIIEPIEGYDHSGAAGINSHLEVAGACRKEDNPNDWRGFLWRNGITFDLNDLITSPDDILVTGATALNEARQIAAFGHNAQGELVSFLLTPLVPLADLDGDCSVGIADLLLLLQQWGMTNSSGDLNGDGTVGILDLLILLANWGS
ncbi:MAG: hypothetical protein IH983_07885 [Planctomycetes bacterium]|nr:hypothetical protein [Planctomycetota bacterium]